MSEYLSKKAALEWLKEQQKRQEEKRDRLEIDHPYWEYHEGASDYLSLAVEEFESGAFDADNTEIQRLRAALGEVYEELKTLHFMIDHDEDIFYERKKKYLSIIGHVGQSVAGQALSTTSEPTNAANARLAGLEEPTMTRDEVLAMKPGRELDALVMQYIFKAEKKDIGDECYWVSEIDGEEVCWPRWFSPSLNISDAFEVLEEIKGRRICIEKTLSGSFYCVIGHSADGHKSSDYQAQTAPEAICKAAMLAVMEGEKDD